MINDSPQSIEPPTNGLQSSDHTGGRPDAGARARPAEMKDRSNLAALAVTLEAIVMALVRAHVSALDQAGRDSFVRAVAANVEVICREVAVMAPAAGRNANLSAGAAKASAARIHRDALDLVKEFEADLTGPLARP